jgi:hypothetical protein
MLRLGLYALIAAILLLAPAALRADAATPPRGFFGVMVNGPLDDPSVDLDAQAAAMRGVGIESWRVEMAWDSIEPQPGQFEWATTDRKVLAAAAHGIDVLEIPPRPVRAWEIWNEPNLSVYFRAQPFARPYAALLRAAYPAVKAADPGATVLMASMANYSWRDLAKLLAVPGPRLRFDAAGAHPFSGKPSNALKIVLLNRQVLDRRGYRRVPMWLTELTWSSAKGKKQPLTQNWETTESGQAQRLRTIYRLLLRNRARLRLVRVFWYTWATVDRGSINSFDYSGLNQALPDGAFRAKPALGAFRAVTRSARG